MGSCRQAGLPRSRRKQHALQRLTCLWPQNREIRMSTSSAEFQRYLQKKRKFEMDLWQTEKQIYDLETVYLESTAAVGNVLKGWEAMLGYRTATAGGANQNKKGFANRSGSSRGPPQLTKSQSMTLITAEDHLGNMEKVELELQLADTSSNHSRSHATAVDLTSASRNTLLKRTIDLTTHNMKRT